MYASSGRSLPENPGAGTMKILSLKNLEFLSGLLGTKTSLERYKLTLVTVKAGKIIDT